MLDPAAPARTDLLQVALPALAISTRFLLLENKK
jgi:hypothetical protein